MFVVVVVEIVRNSGSSSSDSSCVLITLTSSCVCPKCYVSFCWFVLKFACLKFQTKLISFCQMIAFHFGVHFLSRHGVVGNGGSGCGTGGSHI